MRHTLSLCGVSSVSAAHCISLSAVMILFQQNFRGAQTGYWTIAGSVCVCVCVCVCAVYNDTLSFSHYVLLKDSIHFSSISLCWVFPLVLNFVRHFKVDRLNASLITALNPPHSAPERIEMYSGVGYHRMAVTLPFSVTPALATNRLRSPADIQLFTSDKPPSSAYIAFSAMVTSTRVHLHVFHGWSNPISPVKLFYRHQCFSLCSGRRPESFGSLKEHIHSYIHSQSSGFSPKPIF